MSATPRLYVAPDLAGGADLILDGDQAHYLTRVLRLDPGDPVRVFNGRDGEFETALVASTKSTATLRIGDRMREQAGVPDLWLLFAPLKKARTDFVVEKAVELGAREIVPVLTERTDAETVRVDRRGSPLRQRNRPKDWMFPRCAKRQSCFHCWTAGMPIAS